MSLESVLLVTEIENFFKVEIPLARAEKIVTITDATQTVAGLLNIGNEPFPFVSRITDQLIAAAQKNNPGKTPVHPNSLVSIFFEQHDVGAWTSLGLELELEVPLPQNPEENFLWRIIAKPTFSYKDLGFNRLAEVICAFNYEKLVVPQAIKSHKEIELALMGITSHKLGVPAYIIYPHSSFTSDLGID